MEKTFNVTGICYPEENYMVDLSGRLQQTANLVDAGKYFVINRARQYGKTTEYSVASEPFNPLQRAIHSER